MRTELQGRDPRLWRIEKPSVVKQFFATLGKHVIYFAGYGELGYEEEERVQQIARQVLKNWDPSTVIVHTGTLLRIGGNNGIAEVYPIAKELGVQTTGIHPSVAFDFADTHRVSPYCDHVFFIADETWGGLMEGDEHPSQTLRLHLAISDELVVIGGGKHAADELQAFVSNGKKVRFYPADMHHATTRQWTESAGVSIQDMRGAAHLLWLSLQQPEGKT